jgi:hypothetical protein
MIRVSCIQNFPVIFESEGNFKINWYLWKLKRRYVLEYYTSRFEGVLNIFVMPIFARAPGKQTAAVMHLARLRAAEKRAARSPARLTNHRSL